MIKNSIIIPRTAHYYHIGNTMNPSRMLFVIHGYGQKADEFLNYFKDLSRSDTIIISPEGISKYYNKERNVVASWMTSLHRSDEIKDYCNFLDSIAQNIITEFDSIKSIEVLGYSQGASTASRWAFNSKIKIDNLYICSGSCPPELKEAKKIRTNLYFGKYDKILKLENAMKEIEYYNKIFDVKKSLLFDGGHIISQECLKDIE